MHTFTNTTKGPKGVNLKDGSTVYVEAGATSEPLDVAEGELASLKRSEWFDIDASKKAQKEAAEEAAAPDAAAAAPDASAKK